MKSGLRSLTFSGTLTLLFIPDMDNPNAPETGAIVASYIAGESVGAIIQMVLGDKLGRRKFMQLMCIVVCYHSVPFLHSGSSPDSFPD